MANSTQVPIYLAGDGERIMDKAVLSAIGSEAWLDLQVPGMLVRLVLTPGELDDLIRVAQEVRAQLVAAW